MTGVIETVVDVPTRPGVTERVLHLVPPDPKGTLLLIPGGHGGLEIADDGTFGWGDGNFLVRTRALFVDEGVAVAVVDAPSDRPGPTYLGGFRQTAGHVADLAALVAWARGNGHGPVWLVGTSRSAQSVAYAATRMRDADAPDGIVLTSTIVVDAKQTPVSAMTLEDIRVPVLVVHHELDACDYCPYPLVVPMMEQLTGSPRRKLLSFRGGTSDDGPCEAFAYHGFNGIERDVVKQTVAWIVGS